MQIRHPPIEELDAVGRKARKRGCHSQSRAGDELGIQSNLGGRFASGKGRQIWDMKNILNKSYQLVLKKSASGGALLLHKGRVSWDIAASRLASLGFGTPKSVGRDPFLDSSIFHPLREGRAALLEVSRETERCFLALGTTLEKLPDASEALVKHSERLLVLASGKETGEATFDATMSLLEDPLSFIDRSQTQLEDLIVRLGNSIVQINKLIGSEAVLNRAVAPLTYIQTIFKIESAGLDHAVQQMFMALTEDIERLHQQVSQTFGEKFAVLRSARDTIEKVIAQLKADAKSQGTILREKRKSVECAMSQLNSDIQANEQRDIQLTNVSRTINQQVGCLVMSLQTQDIVSQKIAHVANAIAEICRHHEPGLSAAPQSAPGDNSAFCAISCRLQEAQLGAIGNDLTRASGEISGATLNIQKQIAQLDEQCVCLNECDKNTAGADGLVHVLLGMIEEVRVMVHNAVATAEQAYTAICPIGGLASNLTGVMRQFSAQIHLIALNAQVQAAHNCGGTGLEVLASGTAMISVDTRNISERVASGVDKLAVELTCLVETFDLLRQEGAQKRDLMESDARAKELDLHTMRDETLKELKAVGDCVGRIGVLVTDLGGENTLQAMAGEGLDGLRAALTAAAGETTSYLERTGVAVEPGRFSEELSQAYSIASEHEVHRTVFRIEPPSPAVAPGSGLEADPFADVSSVRGDSVIVMTGPHGGRAEASATKSTSLGDNVDLF